MSTQILVPFCFSTFLLNEAIAELSALGLKNLTTIEDCSSGSSLIFGEISPLADLSSLQFSTLQEIETNIWERQWEQFAPHFEEGKAYIHLTEYGGPQLSFAMVPGAGFGDLSHPTTRLCLKALCQAQDLTKTVIDIGTGSGVLALAAHYLGFPSIVAVEIDPPSLEHAKMNFRLNKANSISLQVRIESLPRSPLILLNMTWGEQELLLQNADFLGSAAEWIISGLLLHQVENYLTIYFKDRPYTLTQEGEWACLHISF